MRLFVSIFFFAFPAFSFPVSGQEESSPAGQATEEAPPAVELPADDDFPREVEEPPTIIESDRLEMQAFEESAHFVFSDNVQVTGTNLTVECDLLEVFSFRGDAGDGAMPEIGRIRQIIASGNVRIEQSGRIATAGQADLYPVEGRIVLTENPEIRDENGSVSGPRIILYQGESRAVVESEPGHRPRITLPTLPDLGVEARRPRQRNDQPQPD